MPTSSPLPTHTNDHRDLERYDFIVCGAGPAGCALAGRLAENPGVRVLRIADASIMPNVPSGNTMAPCVVIGERAAEIIKKSHGL